MGFHNKYDGHTLKHVLEQVGRWTGKSPKKGKVDKGYRGRKQINRNRNIKTFASKNIMGYCQQKMLAIHIKKEQLENLIIGHIKTDHRLNRNFYKGVMGDNINSMLAASGFNFKRIKNKWKLILALFSRDYLFIIQH